MGRGSAGLNRLRKREETTPEGLAAIVVNRAFGQINYETGVVATGLGFMLQLAPTDLQAYGLPGSWVAE